MSETAPPRPRKGLFREIALRRYRGPVETDAPHILPKRQSGLVVAAAVIALAIGLLWI